MEGGRSYFRPTEAGVSGWTKVDSVPLLSQGLWWDGSRLRPPFVPGSLVGRKSAPSPFCPRISGGTEAVSVPLLSQDLWWDGSRLRPPFVPGSLVGRKSAPSP